MAEFQWWLLLVGLVAGGGLVAVVSMDSRRREEDLSELERRAEANWIAERLTGPDRELDTRTVESILRVHREYLSLPPPDRLVVEGAEAGETSDVDADGVADEIGDDGGRRTDQDLPHAREEEAAAREEAHAGADSEQRTAR
jgi:hypothetical protein